MPQPKKRSWQLSEVCTSAPILWCSWQSASLKVVERRFCMWGKGRAIPFWAPRERLPDPRAPLLQAADLDRAPAAQIADLHVATAEAEPDQRCALIRLHPAPANGGPGAPPSPSAPSRSSCPRRATILRRGCRPPPRKHPSADALGENLFAKVRKSGRPPTRSFWNLIRTYQVLLKSLEPCWRVRWVRGPPRTLRELSLDHRVLARYRFSPGSQPRKGDMGRPGCAES